MLRTTLLSLFILLSHASAKRDSDRFYVWQQEWSSSVIAAVFNETLATLYPLAAVVPKEGNCTLINVPWGKLAVADRPVVPVVRIPLGAFKRTDIASELNRITRRLYETAETLRIDEIQLDLDCPERLLPEYHQLIIAYRRDWPDLKLSITALPAHLNNASFRPLAEAVDYYVLQVHGLDVPATFNDQAELLKLSIAERAIRQAEDLERPYRIALPCYAYELNFDQDSGDFLFLTAEHLVENRETIKKRIAANPADLIALLDECQRLKVAEGIIWFRLPVEGDRLCLPRAALAKIQQGKQPADQVECRTHRISDTTLELELFNGNTIHAATASLKLDWPESIGTYDLYQHVDKESLSARLPTELSISMPPPGEAVRLGWFESKQPPTIKIELQ